MTTKRWFMCAAAVLSLSLAACAEDVETDEADDLDDPTGEAARYDDDSLETDEAAPVELEDLEGRDRIRFIPGPFDGDPGPAQPRPVPRPAAKDLSFPPARVPVLVDTTPV